MKVKFDKILGRIREKDSGSGLPAGYNSWQEYINNIIVNSLDLPDQFNSWANFIDWLTQNITDLPDNFNSWADYINWQINNSNTSKLTRLISGSVTWLQNLDFLVSPLVYEINGQRIESAERTITLPANVAANPMFTIIIADIFAEISYIQGTPAADPAIPIVTDTTTQLAILPVYIPANSSTPGNITNTVIYNENTEWATAATVAANVTANFNAVTAPANGTKHITVDFNNPAATAAPVRGKLFISTLTINKTIEVTGTPNSFNWLLTELSDYHKTDTTINNLRKVSWFNWKNLNDVKIKLTDTANQQTFIFKPESNFNTEDFSIPELDFSVTIPQNLRCSRETNILSGIYQLVIEGLTSYDQYYTMPTVTNIPAAGTVLTFTNPDIINVASGNLILSLKTSKNWLSNTGLLFEIFKTDETTPSGSLAFLPGSFYGFNPQLPDYQKIVIPLEDFNRNNPGIKSIKIKFTGQFDNETSVLIDNVYLQTGAQPEIKSFKVITDKSVSGDGTLENPIVLVNDSDSPGISKYFGTDISGVKGWHLLPYSGENIYIVYNESELLAAYTSAISYTDKAATIYIGATITLTANRSFIRAYGNPNISFVGIGITQVIAVQNTTLQVNFVTFRNISFSTTGHYYLTVNGGYVSLYNVRWISEQLYNADVNLMKINIRITGIITNGTGQIFIDGLYHASATHTHINDGDIQPFIIENSTAWASIYNCYINILRMEALKDFDRFSRVLIHATANLRALVTGDLSWFYHSDQVWPGSGFILSESILLKKGSIEDLRGDYMPVGTVENLIGINSSNKMVKAAAYPATQTIAYSATPTHNFLTGKNGKITLTADVTTYTLSNVPDGAHGTISIIQNATGGFGIAAIVHSGLTVQYLAGQAPTAANINSSANGHTLLNFDRIGDVVYINFGAFN